MSKALITESSLTDIANAIIAKDGGAAMTPGQMATRIENLPSGSHDYKFDKPAEWPDIEQILAADTTTGFTHKVIALYDDLQMPRVGNGIAMYGASAYKTSDGNYYTSNGIRDVTATNCFRWVIFYSNEKIVANCHNFGSVNRTFNNYNANVLWLYGSEMSCAEWGFSGQSKLRCVNADVTSSQYSFNHCVSIEYVKVKEISANEGYNFYNCRSIKTAFSSDVDYSGYQGVHLFEEACSMIDFRYIKNFRQTASNCFTNVVNAEYLPDIDFTGLNSGFSPNAYRLKAIPQFTPNSSSASNIIYDFGVSAYVEDIDSIAKIEDGVVTGGIAATFPSVASGAGTRTIKFNAALQARFGDNRTIMETAFTNKGWTVAWQS